MATASTALRRAKPRCAGRSRRCLANLRSRTGSRWARNVRLCRAVAALGGHPAKMEGKHELFAFLTTEPNAVVAPIHPKAMCVLLTTAEEHDTEPAAPAQETLVPRRPSTGR